MEEGEGEGLIIRSHLPLPVSHLRRLSHQLTPGKAPHDITPR